MLRCPRLQKNGLSPRVGASRKVNLISFNEQFALAVSGTRSNHLISVLKIGGWEKLCQNVSIRGIFRHHRITRGAIDITYRENIAVESTATWWM